MSTVIASPPSTPLGSAGNTAGASYWLAGRTIDLPLLLVTPLLLIPLFTWLSHHLADQMIVLAVTLFGANAHHLPGFIRAYGDPAFRSRYRLRLTLAPIAIIGTCLAFFHLNLNGLLFVAFLWGIWHALAQVYGIGRMYDGRASLISASTARLDKIVCIAWFFGGFLFSAHRLNLALTELYRCGVPAISAESITVIRWIWMAGTLVATSVWGVNQFRLARAGEGNPLKVVLFLSSFGFWWYANIPIESAIVGVVLFEAFHDVQYLTTVWLYNQRIVSKGERLGAFSRVLFRPGVIGIVIYIGLCFLYGSSGLIGKSILGEGAVKTIGALVLSSLLLHFYYDSFLWNVRDRAVREDFDLKEGEGSAAPIGPSSVFKVPEGLAWAWFVVPLVALIVAQSTVSLDERTWRERLALSLPESESVLLELGRVQFEEGLAVDAVSTFERAVELDPESGKALRGLVEAYARSGNVAKALGLVDRLEEAGALDSRTLVSLGVVSHGSSPAAAEDFFVRALQMDPANLEARMNLASVYLDRGKIEQAHMQLLEGRRQAPGDASVIYNLGLVELARGDLPAAAEAFTDVVRIQPGFPGAAQELRRIQARLRSSDRR